METVSIVVKRPAKLIGDKHGDKLLVIWLLVGLMPVVLNTLLMHSSYLFIFLEFVSNNTNIEIII